MIGSIVKVTVDRPLGSYHPQHKDWLQMEKNRTHMSLGLTPRSKNLLEKSLLSFTDMMMLRKNGLLLQKIQVLPKRK